MAEPPPTPRRHSVSLLVGTALLTILLYAPALGGGFLYFDDPENVLDNAAIRHLDAATVAHWFTAPLQYMYTPLVWLSFAVDHRLGGLDPWTYHLTNLLLHLANVGLVYLVCRALTRREFVVGFVTVGFAIHPVNVDTVAWISARSTLLATLFSLGTLLAYLRYRQTRRTGYLLWAYPLFALATLAKSTAVALPLALLLVDHYRGRRPDRRMLLEKLPFFVVALVVGAVGLHLRIDVSPLHRYDPLDRVVVVCSALAAYLGRVVVPYPLSFAYAYPDEHGSFLPWYVYLTPVLLALLPWLLLRAGVPGRTVAFGLGFFAVNVVLSQTVVLVDNHAANRYVYLPYLGLFLILGHLARRVPARTVLARTVLALAVAALAMISHQRAELWHHPIAVLDDTLRHEPRLPFVYTVRGITRYRGGDRTAALADFDSAIALDPSSALNYYYQGVIKSESGDPAGAVPDLDRAIATSTGFAAAYSERGKARLATHDLAGALADLDHAIALDRYLVDAYLHRATARRDLGDTAGACADWRTAREFGNQTAAQAAAEHCAGG